MVPGAPEHGGIDWPTIELGGQGCRIIRSIKTSASLGASIGICTDLLYTILGNQVRIVTRILPMM